MSFDEFLKLKGEQKEPRTIYFDEQQWKTLTKGLRPVKGKLPKKGIRLAFIHVSVTTGRFWHTLVRGNSRFMLAGFEDVVETHGIDEFGKT